MNSVTEYFISMTRALYTLCIFFLPRNNTGTSGSFRRCTLHILPHNLSHCIKIRQLHSNLSHLLLPPPILWGSQKQ